MAWQELSENFLIGLTVLSMALCLLISLIPSIPGPAIIWAIGTLFAALSDFERVPWYVVVWMSVLMLIGSSSEWWLRYLGMSSRGGSCWGFLGSLIGGLLGTIFIPIPILGTLIGAIGGALVVEFVRLGQVDQALQSGRAVLETYLLTIVVEFICGGLILASFVASLWWTA
jgi:uncharacterized protein YqgC (DUF456 family)